MFAWLEQIVKYYNTIELITIRKHYMLISTSVYYRILVKVINGRKYRQYDRFGHARRRFIG